ncbi:hypothetical protein V6N11_046970 [Hibiscus sabdariffa]|uniref:Uncharacterized protein n=1 Tax=Hibiscus sabdariffa TaxID=183260 RepID=A0ABR2NDA3_9ROSI
MNNNIPEIYNTGANNSTPFLRNTADINANTILSAALCFPTRPPPPPAAAALKFLERPWRNRGDEGGEGERRNGYYSAFHKDREIV